jgi:hypothetical protein
MKRVTRWQPDTCECKIDIEFEDGLDPKFVVVEPCKAHANLKAKQDASSVYHENVKKNTKLLEVRLKLAGVNTIEQLESMIQQRIDEKAKAIGVQVQDLSDPLRDTFSKASERELGVTTDELAWKFDESRKLKISLPNRLKHKVKSLNLTEVDLE